MPVTPVVSITFDDALTCQFDTAMPIMDKLGIPATFFLMANDDPYLFDGMTSFQWPKLQWDKPTIKRLRKVIARGHEIGSHGKYHFRDFLDRHPDYNACESKQWIEERMETECPSYCYPFGHCPAPIVKSIKAAGYEQARTGGGARRGIDPKNFFKVNSWKVDPEEDGKLMLKGPWFVLMYHAIGSDADGWAPVPENRFVRQMETLNWMREDNLIDIVTFGEAANIFRQEKTVCVSV